MTMGAHNGGTRQERSPGSISVVQALEIARDSPEGAQDSVIVRILETALSKIWAKVMNSKLREASGVADLYETGLEAQSTEALNTSCEKISGHDAVWAEGKVVRSSEKFSGRWKLFVLVFVACCVSLGWLLIDCTPANVLDEQQFHTATYEHLVKYAAAASSATPTPTGVLEVFQVYQPVLTPQGAVDETVLSNGQESTNTIASAFSPSSCEVLLMKYDFAYSYGAPFVGNYTPPKCRQFDRLALMYFGDTEVWRTSTAEPTTDGIVWTYVKDMTEFMYFWESPQTLIFDLGNLIDSTYTGIFNTTLTATFFTTQDTVEPADLIIPISARNGATVSPSVFTLPSDNATNTISFPRNVNRAVFSVSACGQAAEEFWWGNVLQSDVDTFEPYDGTLYGYSPWREVQILIDGQLAGVEWPFPVIFTGGVVPGLWRPIVGIDAFDLREHEIDITPWLPILCNGKEHTFEIRVAGILDDGKGKGVITETVGASWYVTGKIFVWLDDASSITTGQSPTIRLPAPVISVSQHLTQNATGANETLSYTTNVKRQLSISSEVKSQRGSKLQTWTQSLTATNYGLYTGYGATQENLQSTVGTDESSGGVSYKTSYSYPLYANTTYLVQPSGSFSLEASVIRGLDLAVYGTPVFPTGLQPFASIPKSKPLVSGFSGTQLSTTQNGTAYYFSNATTGTSSGFGSTSQEFTFSGIDASGGVTDTELYYRNVEAVNSTIVKDDESLVGQEFRTFGFPAASVAKTQAVFGALTPKEALGRGPGKSKQVLVQGRG
ncbi:PNGase A large chain [Hyphodiscus hymeniophilus]|uniref:PNGase A large chain n=1 Tax=Hyphodiscus hymeniophilus TaxID=353542 RepID=A0A9P6VPA9_9HELO|nr:PNGase A large chain [Hyphodiscus hymeniophilus]